MLRSFYKIFQKLGMMSRMNRWKNKFFFLLHLSYVSIIVIVSLHLNVIVHNFGDLIDVVVFIKHTMIQDVENFFPPDFFYIVFNDAQDFLTMLLLIKQWFLFNIFNKLLLRFRI